MKISGGVRLAVTLLVLTAANPAAAQLYKWTDADGVERYTNDLATIPPAHRASARDIGSPSARPEQRTPAPEPGTITISAGQPIRTAVRLNGVPMTLVLDTGADRTVISPAAIARAGMQHERGREVQIVGATGSATAREVVVERLDLAGTHLGPLAIVVHDIGMAGADGLLGRDVLDAFTLTIDPAAGRATLTPR